MPPRIDLTARIVYSGAMRDFLRALRSLAFLTILSAVASGAFSEARAISLWSGASGMERADSAMFMSKPRDANGTAVIICPGGSYHHLGMYSEGHRSAKWFNSLGVTTFVLRYRTASGGWHHPAQLQDIQRALQLVRENAADYGIDAHKVGVIGFSAGGHLALMAGAFYESDDELLKLGIQTDASLRPDFIVAVYPVVSMRDGVANFWSRKSLLHKDMSEAHKEKFSMEKQVHEDMPPTYIAACRDDDVVAFENSELLYAALLAKGVPCRFAAYDWGGHGFGMLDNAFMKAFHWNDALADWLGEMGFLAR